MTNPEDGLRQAATCNWMDFNSPRVYADWLEEQGRADEAVVWRGIADRREDDLVELLKALAIPRQWHFDASPVLLPGPFLHTSFS
jgi:uncharacterized protein (TIGR02996 family)